MTEAGGVYRYKPDGGVTHCREGLAVSMLGRDGLILVDTFWGSGTDAHVLTDTERATAELVFNTADYRELGRGESFEDYRPEDRQVITSQHRLQVRRFVRNGSTPDLSTKIANAQTKVQEAIKEADWAEQRVTWAREELAELESQKEAHA